MALTNFPNGLSSAGAPVVGGGGSLPFSTGKYFYVHYSTGSDGNSGTDPSQPFKTIDYAVGRCTANKGDVIVALPGHAETLIAAAGIDLDVAGITLVGVGNGSLIPTITLGTATTADIDVDADNITIRGLKFVSNINSLANIIDVNSERTVIENCIFESSSEKEVVCFIDLATTKDYLTVRGCKFFQPTDPEGTDGAAATGCFYFVDSEHILVENCEFNGNFETAIFHNKTTAAKYVWIRNCYGVQALTGGEVFTQVANMSGAVQNSIFIVSGADDVTEAKTWGTLSVKYFIDVNSCVGNDGDGGQLAVAGASAAT